MAKREHYYSEEEKVAYWRQMFPSGSFWCGHCKETHDLMAHRKSQVERGKPQNLCSCGASLAYEAYDGERASARRGAPGGRPAGGGIV